MTLKILLVEDNEVNQKVASLMLGKMNYHVTIAQTGPKALEAFRSEHFDLIFMDVQMPDMDGYEITKKIRDDEKVSGKRIPIVALTAGALKGDREKCLEAGMDDYLTKPVNMQQLAGAISKFTGVESCKSSKSEKTGYDIQKAVEFMGGDLEVFDEISNLFLEESSKRMQLLKEGIEKNDFNLVAKIAHQIKGSIAIFAAEAARELAAKLEMAGEKKDLCSAKKVYEELEMEIKKIEKEIRNLKGSL